MPAVSNSSLSKILLLKLVCFLELPSCRHLEFEKMKISPGGIQTVIFLTEHKQCFQWTGQEHINSISIQSYTTAAKITNNLFLWLPLCYQGHALSGFIPSVSWTKISKTSNWWNFPISQLYPILFPNPPLESCGTNQPSKNSFPILLYWDTSKIPLVCVLSCCRKHNFV